MIKPIPDGYRSITPYMFIRGAADAIEFYKKAFGAEERLRLDRPDGKVGHAELEIGDSVIMITDECEEFNAYGPQTLKGTSFGIHLYVEDVDTTIERAAAGAKLISPAEDKFYGDRNGTIEDPFGHRWFVYTHVKDVSPEGIAELARNVGKEQERERSGLCKSYFGFSHSSEPVSFTSTSVNHTRMFLSAPT